MVTRASNNLREKAYLTFEMIVAIGLIAGALLPISYSVLHERKLLRAEYYRAVAMELVDGELEVLRHAPPEAGAREIVLTNAAAANLPKGRFEVTRKEKTLRVEWRPEKRGQGGAVLREVKLP